MKESRIKLPQVDQIGIVVKDVDKAIEYYSSTFGLGPFQIREVKQDGFTYKGKIGSSQLKIAFTKSGSLEIELIQVLSGETPHTEFLKNGREGLHHLRFTVDDLDKMLAELAKEEIIPIYHQRLAPGVAFAYVNSDKTGGIIFELFESKGL